ncbi:hypothetical protein BV22DRAFT_1060945 [Leucogyrophana mollusca]|uniref:Uncharacterized protein n=1 Tax=Leucogyrophana mollusca TaxID=85980 RepID=A0ACB8BS79_9AGAM|nr:hypothetical protein BV22DRAFT_1060945 [Leucogyrophana mollusca]
MPFGLIIGTDRAAALQNSIQDELTARGYSQDADPVMAEYITIMIINNKTAAQITAELEDLIGSDFDPSFTDWLFVEAAKGAPESEAPLPAAASAPSQPEQPSDSTSKPSREQPPHLSNRPPTAPRASAPIYQQALNQTFPSTSPSAQKRLRSPSPGVHGPVKARRTDVPTGPRAMTRDGASAGSRSLLERVGGPARTTNANGYGARDDIQARIDNITNNSPDPTMMMAAYQNGGMGPGGMNGMGGPGMADMTMASPMMLQEMMMNQMALMAQMASSMGMLNPANGQMMNGGYPGMQGEAGMFNGGASMNGTGNGMNGNGFQQNTRGRGGVRGGRGRGGGRGGHHTGSSPAPERTEPQAPVPSVPEALQAQVSTGPTPIAAPVPTHPATSSSAAPQIAYALPERPQSPTLCKFGTKCTNSQCRYSHPSPVATAESGVVLSTDACEKGKDCKDKDCIKSHVSPAVNNPGAETQKPPVPSVTVTPSHTPHTVPCRFGASCTRPTCTYSHPPRPHAQNNHFAQQCRFGAGCTRTTCPFQHPEGRVLPTSFHRGLSSTAPMVNVQPPETGSMGGPSPHRSVTFNSTKPGESVKEKLERQMKDIEAQKEQAKKAVADAQAAAGKKEESNPVAIAV